MPATLSGKYSSIAAIRGNQPHRTALLSHRIGPPGPVQNASADLSYCLWLDLCGAGGDGFPLRLRLQLRPPGLNVAYHSKEGASVLTTRNAHIAAESIAPSAFWYAAFASSHLETKSPRHCFSARTSPSNFTTGSAAARFVPPVFSMIGVSANLVHCPSFSRLLQTQGRSK